MQSQSPSPSRKELEQELTAFALHIGEKSYSEAAAMLLELYQKFKLAEMESEVSVQLQHAEEQMRSALEARMSELTVEVQPPSKDEVNMPTPPAPVQLEIPSAMEEPVPPSEPEAASEPEDLEALKLVVKETPEKEEAPEKETTSLDVDAGIEPEETAMPYDEPLPQNDRTASQEGSTLSERAQQSGTAKSLNDRFAQKVLKFGLNDRIGFVKALFEGNQEDFNRVISQLNTLSSLHEATEFIDTYVAPEYKWEQQEEMAERFMLAVATKFS
jgi:hypothetical protein